MCVHGEGAVQGEQVDATLRLDERRAGSTWFEHSVVCRSERRAALKCSALSSSGPQMSHSGCSRIPTYKARASACFTGPKGTCDLVEKAPKL